MDILGKKLHITHHEQWFLQKEDQLLHSNNFQNLIPSIIQQRVIRRISARAKRQLKERLIKLSSSSSSSNNDNRAHSSDSNKNAEDIDNIDRIEDMEEEGDDDFGHGSNSSIGSRGITPLSDNDKFLLASRWLMKRYGGMYDTLERVYPEYNWIHWSEEFEQVYQ